MDEKAVARIELAILKPRNILVFGDYDVDGNSGFTAILLSKTYYPNIAIPIPDRYAEGYGISFKGIDYLVDNCFYMVILWIAE
jgi:single-stranded-DNA-specific exonuclease